MTSGRRPGNKKMTIENGDCNIYWDNPLRLLFTFILDIYIGTYSVVNKVDMSI